MIDTLPDHQRPGRPASLAQTLYQRLLQRELRELAAIREGAEWVEHDGCQVSTLLPPILPIRWPSPAATARGVWKVRSPARPHGRPQIDPAVWSKGLALQREYEKQLRDPRALARFLCGVSSPWLVKAKLQSHPLFGALSHVPFPTVLEQAKTGHAETG